MRHLELVGVVERYELICESVFGLLSRTTYIVTIFVVVLTNGSSVVVKSYLFNNNNKKFTNKLKNINKVIHNQIC